MARQSSVLMNPRRPSVPTPPAVGSSRHALPVTDLAPYLDRLVRDLGRTPAKPASRLRPGLWHT